MMEETVGQLGAVGIAFLAANTLCLTLVHGHSLTYMTLLPKELGRVFYCVSRLHETQEASLR